MIMLPVWHPLPTAGYGAYGPAGRDEPFKGRLLLEGGQQQPQGPFGDQGAQQQQGAQLQGAKEEQEEGTLGQQGDWPETDAGDHPMLPAGKVPGPGQDIHGDHTMLPAYEERASEALRARQPAGSVAPGSEASQLPAKEISSPEGPAAPAAAQSQALSEAVDASAPGSQQQGQAEGSTPAPEGCSPFPAIPCTGPGVHTRIYFPPSVESPQGDERDAGETTDQDLRDHGLVLFTAEELWRSLTVEQMLQTVGCCREIPDLGDLLETRLGEQCPLARTVRGWVGAKHILWSGCFMSTA